jgi:hypothetical protein
MAAIPAMLEQDQMRSRMVGRTSGAAAQRARSWIGAWRDRTFGEMLIDREEPDPPGALVRDSYDS